MTDRSPDEGLFDRAVLAGVVDAAADGVVVVDGDGTVRYWNGGAQRIFGFTSEEAVGANLDLIIPERFRERHWEAFAAAVASGKSRYRADDLLSVPALRSDGQRISIEFTVALIPGDAGIRYVAAVVRDVTERRAKEMDLRRQVAELSAAASGQGGAAS